MQKSLHRLDARDPGDVGERVQILHAHLPQPDAVERAVAAGEGAVLLDALAVEALGLEVEDDDDVARPGGVLQRRASRPDAVAMP